ncbi:hypothetical protein INR75_05075 [Zunongwangia sp. SCSIO 43204]|uniref:hypothetical protein n=1 Tax=Zunongwangia sp. SCSIO 43204 TaxID=2779359 RepID=UPI001CA82AE8|nr:hypothetical protein [Zunongwangia sp. SCSIO 43204]UAB85393.1 hypothetical protein INR75_05075 [Zunongwangia sp. SCSIO 43204]
MSILPAGRQEEWRALNYDMVSKIDFSIPLRFSRNDNKITFLDVAYQAELLKFRLGIIES